MDDTSIPDLSPEERTAAKKAYMARWRAQNKARIKAYQKVWIASNVEHVQAYARDYVRRNKERFKARLNASGRRHYHKDIEASRAYGRAKRQRLYEQNPLRQLSSSLRWKESHRAEGVEYALAWVKEHPEQVRATQQRRRASKRNAPINDFTADDWRALCKAAGYHCAYCGKKFPFKELTQDHITPLSKGGSHTLSNILPACHSCNSRKHAKDVPTPVQPFLLLEI